MDAPSPEQPPEPPPAPPPTTENRTFLIADIRGYTAYTRERGDEAGAELAGRFATLVREVVVAHEGFLLELRGDEALCVFVSARHALRAAVDLQERVRAQALPRGVGIGLDAGEAIPLEGGYRGSALNLAARLCSLAGPGETIASETVIHLAAHLEGIRYVDPETVRVKGFEPVRSVRIVSDAEVPRRLGRSVRRFRRRATSYPRAHPAITAALVTTLMVVVVVAAFSLRLPGPSAATLGSAAPSASAPPTSATSPQPSDWPHLLSAGPYVNDRFDPPFSVQLGDGWFLHNSYVDAIGFIRNEDEEQAIDIVHLQVVWPTGCPFESDGTPTKTALVGRTSDDVVRWVQSHPNLAVGDPQPVNVARISGLTIDAEVVRGAGKASFCAAGDDPNGDYLYLFPVGGYGDGQGDVLSVLKGSRLRFMILEANGRAITIIIRAPSDVFDSFAGKAGEVIDSLEFSGGTL